MGGGKGGGSAPAAPNPTKVAAAQTQSNIETAIANAWMNATNQYTPFGSVTYDQTGTQKVGKFDVPTFTSNMNLTPEQQAIFNSQQGIQQGLLNTGTNMLGQVNNALGGQFNLEGIPQLPQDQEAYRRSVEQGLTQRFNQDWERQDAAVRNRLANQGIQEGSEAWNAEMQNLARARNDANNQAFLSSGAEAQRMFQLAQQARQQGIQDRVLERSQPINEVSGLFGLGKGIQLPSFNNQAGAQVQPTDIAGITQNAYNQNLAAWQQGQQNQNSMLGGFAGIGGSIAGALPWGSWFSDRRVKQDIKKVGELDSGLPVYSYKYKWGGPTQIGLMAQDVEKENPEAVGHLFGVKTVDYGKAVEA